MSSSSVYAMIFNIPSSYHASQLRDFFSEIVESSGFENFHYRHRPMMSKPRILSNNDNSKSGKKENCEKIAAAEPSTSAACDDRNNVTSSSDVNQNRCFLKPCEL